MTRKVLAAVAALLGLLALLRPVTRQPKEISPIQLAEWIRGRKPGLRVIDLRSVEQFDDFHIPRAERFDIESLASTTFKPDETIVLAGDDAHVFGDRQVYILRGGLRGWFDEVMNPTITENAPPAERAAFQRVSDVSRYFGGMPRVVDKPQAPAHAAVTTFRRRGC